MAADYHVTRDSAMPSTEEISALESDIRYLISRMEREWAASLATGSPYVAERAAELTKGVDIAEFGAVPDRGDCIKPDILAVTRDIARGG
jgi:hypothetical protein